MDEIFLINKPRSISSFAVVDYLKKKFKLTKVGHAGTLDPLAEGLLIILVGKATKKFSYFQSLEKEYLAEITFGKETDTYDSEGKITFVFPQKFSLSEQKLKKILQNFSGEILHKPPPYSAIKIKGKRAYQLARKGKKVILKTRRTKIFKTRLLKIKDKTATILFVVSSGTYIRALAYDIGKATGLGAYLSGLKRTRIGSYLLSKAETPDKVSLKDLIPI